MARTDDDERAVDDLVQTIKNHDRMAALTTRIAELVRAEKKHDGDIDKVVYWWISFQSRWRARRVHLGALIKKFKNHDYR